MTGVPPRYKNIIADMTRPPPRMAGRSGRWAPGVTVRMGGAVGI